MFWNILCLAWYVYSVQCIKLYSFLLLNRTHAQIAPIRLTANMYISTDMTVWSTFGESVVYFHRILDFESLIPLIFVNKTIDSS